MEKRKNCKMPISIRYGKNVKIAKCQSQLGMEKRKNRKIPISIYLLFIFCDIVKLCLVILQALMRGLSMPRNI